MKIHQILINDSKKIPSNLPEYSTICTEQFLNLYPDNQYNLYSAEEIENIIKENFDEDVLISYRMLKPYSFKADLAKYCLLYLYGGFYFDLSIFFLNQIPYLDEFDFFAFRDRSIDSIKTWMVASGIMYSKPRCSIMSTCINIVVENCKNKFYGEDVSGPAILGESIVLNHRNSDQSLLLGERQPLLSEDFMNIKNKFPILHNKIFDNIKEGFVSDILKDFICLCKPSRAGDIESLGFDGTNNYLDMFLNFDVYDETIKFNTPKYFYS
jgi:hypothetical protein